jgi:hypothetical protein
MPIPFEAVELPLDLLNEIDVEVGSEQREAFLVEASQAELRRRRMRESQDGAKNGNSETWMGVSHPGLAKTPTEDEQVPWEVRRLRLLEFLEDIKNNGPVWKDEDHPELANGSYAWVRSLRDGSERRLDDLEARRTEE